MGVFPLPIHDIIVAPINMISYVGTHFNDPHAPRPSNVNLDQHQGGLHYVVIVGWIIIFSNTMWDRI